MVRIAALLALIVAGSATAQKNPSARFMDNCRRDRGDDNARYCEQRTLDMPVTKRIRVDAEPNGSITVHGSDKSEVRIIAMVEGWARDDGTARDIAKQVTVTARDGEVRADGPASRRRESWSVSYEIWLPRQTDLSLASVNGGVAVDGVDGEMDLRTENGGLNLIDVAGDVRGTTSNGSVSAELQGSTWRGRGLDLRTSNGSVRITIPKDYSAQVETGTVNGSVSVDFPITVQGRINRHLTTTLGKGGPLIRATTTNGSVRIAER